jgi:uncharacterized Zn-binding protein involved in type VI secretion
MPAICRVGDICSGHDCFPPRPIITGSEDVFLNGKGVARLGDALTFHCKPCGKNPRCHPSTIAGGSSSVFVNGIAVARIGDPIACGSVCATASPDVGGGG